MKKALLILLFLLLLPPASLAQFIGGSTYTGADSLVSTSIGTGTSGVVGYNTLGTASPPNRQNLSIVIQVVLSSSTACGTIVPDANSTLIAGSVASATGLCDALFFRTGSVSDPSSLSYAWTGSQTYDIRTYIVSNTSTVDAASSNNGSGTSFVANSVTTTVAGDYLMGFFATLGTGTWNAPPAPMGFGVKNDPAFVGPPNFRNLMISQWMYPIGATGSKTETVTGPAVQWVANLLALKPLYAVPPHSVLNDPVASGTSGQYRTSGGPGNPETWASPISGTFTAVLGTSAIASNSCATTVTVSVPGTTTSSALAWQFASDPNTIVGYGSGAAGDLTVDPFLTSGNANFRVCNLNGGPITPGAMSLTFKVIF